MDTKGSVVQAVQSCHRAMVWFIPQIDKFPRNRRFTLGERLEAGLLDVLSLLVEASYTSRGKSRLLEQANTGLTVVRHLWRMAFELKVVAEKQYHHGSKLLVGIGQQVGAWLKSSV